MSESLLIWITKAPQAASSNQEAIDLALAAASFDQKVTLLFSDDGLLQLIDDQAPDTVGRKNLSKMLKALPIYDIESVSIRADNFCTPELSNTKIISKEESKGLIQKHDSVLRF